MAMSLSKQRLGKFVVACALLWSWMYITWGGTSAGKSFFKKVASKEFPSNAKSATPLIALTLPLLRSSSFVSLLYKLPNFCNGNGNGSTRGRIRDAYRGVQVSVLVLVFLPVLSYIVCVMYRKLSDLYASSSHDRELHSHDASFEDTKWSKIANIFGMSATLSLAWLLIVPVSRNSILIHLCVPSSNWYPHLHFFHIWTGRFAIILGTIHGTLHLFRQYVYSSDPIFLTGSCAGNADCAEDVWQNWSGLLGLICMWIILLSSWNTIRRKYYRTFYILHIFVVPLLIVILTCHWNRWSLYMTPSILYYLASTLPDKFRNHSKQQHPKISSYTPIGNNVHSIIFDTLSEGDYHVGQFVKLQVPNICPFSSHPFTINQRSEDPPQMEILFKATGPFTNALAKYLSHRNQEIRVHGYFGPETRRLDMAHHSTNIILAGGIGITPYLSLLHKCLTTNTCTSIDLHWVCHDEALIQYVQTNYFQPLVQKRTEICQNSASQQPTVTQHYIELPSCPDCPHLPQITITIHTTCQSPIHLDESEWNNTISSTSVTTSSSLKLPPQSLPEDNFEADGGDEGVVDESRVLDLQSTSTKLSSWWYFLSWNSIAWLGFVCIWYMYSHQKETDRVFHDMTFPLWGILVTIIMAILVSMLMNYLMPHLDRHKSYSTIQQQEMNASSSSSTRQSNQNKFSLRLCNYEGKRPVVASLLRQSMMMDTDNNIGIYICGPKSLTEDIKEHLNTLPSKSHTIYEELFEY